MGKTHVPRDPERKRGSCLAACYAGVTLRSSVFANSIFWRCRDQGLIQTPGLIAGRWAPTGPPSRFLAHPASHTSAVVPEWAGTWVMPPKARKVCILHSVVCYVVLSVCFASLHFKVHPCIQDAANHRETPMQWPKWGERGDRKPVPRRPTARDLLSLSSQRTVRM
jgi:hypothetical protein